MSAQPVMPVRTLTPVEALIESEAGAAVETAAPRLTQEATGRVHTVLVRATRAPADDALVYV